MHASQVAGRRFNSHKAAMCMIAKHQHGFKREDSAHLEGYVQSPINPMSSSDHTRGLQLFVSLR